MTLPELDYAYLADFAQVSDGKLTAVGASFTHMLVVALGEPKPLFLAGRIRVAENSEPLEVGIKVSGPDNTFTIEASFVMGAGPNQLAYDGKVGLLFAAGMTVPLVAEGLYEVILSVQHAPVRRLAFSVNVQGSSAQ